MVNAIDDNTSTGEDADGYIRIQSNLPGDHSLNGVAMCRRPCENVGSQSAFWRFSDSHIPISYKYLLLGVIASFGLTIGCTTSETGRRTFALNPLRSARSHFPSPKAEVTAGQDPNRAAGKSASNDQSAIQLVAGRDESIGDNSQPRDVVETVSPIETSSPIESGSGVEFPPAMTLAHLEALAIQNNPTLSQAQAAISAEQGIYHQAGLYPNPQVGYLNESATSPGVKAANGGFFSQEIITAKKLDLAQQSASAEIKRYHWDHESQRMRVLNDLKIRYYEVLGAQESLVVSERLVKIAEKTLAMLEKRMETIHGTRTDVLQARVQLETVRLTRDEAENRYIAAWDRLATMIGVSRMQPTPLVGDLAADVPQLDLETCQQQLLGNSPQIRSTECDLAHAWATYREARAQAKPNVTIQSVSEYDRVTQAATFSTLVALPLPISNRNQGNIEKSSADIVAAQAEIVRVQLVLREQLVDSFQRYKNSLRQTERLKTVILPSAEENLKLTEQVYETGEIAFASVLTAQQSYFQSQVAYVEALTDVHKVATEIQGLQLTGGLNPAAIGSAIQNQPGGGAQRQRALLNDVQDKASRQLLPAAQLGR